MSNKKCIIIGSGLGGLSCGVILSRNGYDVTVLEQGSQIGGCLQCFMRKGVKFETGMHFIGSAAPGQTLYKMMRYLGLGEIPLSPLDRNGYDAISLAGEKFLIPNGQDELLARLGEYFPHEKDNVVKYLGIVNNIAQASALQTMKYAESDFALNAQYQTVSINSVLDELFNTQEIKHVLAGNLPLYAAQLDKTPFSLHAFIMSFYNPSSYRIIGGSDIMAGRLADEIRSNGGVVKTNSKVTKIICNDTGATGVEINGGEFIATDQIVSTIHPARLMELLDTNLLRPVFKKRMSGLPNTPAVFSVYMKFKPQSVPYQNFNLYSYTTPNPWNSEVYTADEWPKGFLYMHFCDRPDQQYATSGVVMAYMDYSETSRWKGTAIGRRGQDYEDFKREHAEKLLSRLEETYPGLQGRIEAYYTSTPLTYEDYTGTEAGGMYGVAKDVTLGNACRVPQRTKIPNLLLAGQNVNSHGMLGVLVGSIVACSELLSSQTIYNQIIKANE